MKKRIAGREPSGEEMNHTRAGKHSETHCLFLDCLCKVFENITGVYGKVIVPVMLCGERNSVAAPMWE